MDCQDYITESVERKKGQHLQREERGAIQHLKNAGIQRPLVFFDLFHYPANEASAVTDSVWFPRTLSVRLVDRFSTPCRVSGLPALAALSGRCAAL